MKRSKLWLASILKKWASSLSGENQEKENYETSRERQKTDPEARRAAPVTWAIVDIADPILEEYRRNQKEESAKERKNRTIAIWAVIGAWLVAVIGVVQSCLTNIANHTSQQQLNLSQRPWISLDLSTLSIENGTLIFNEKGAFTTITGEMTNKGNSVAIHTMVSVKIMDMSQFPIDAQMHTPQLCNSPGNLKQTVGYNLFPGDRAPVNQEAGLDPKDIVYGIAHGLIKSRVMPEVIVCIQYQSVFEPKYHLTQYVFSLLNSQSISAFEPKSVIPDLHLVHEFFGDLAY
jgi:hypothetical protein